MAVNTTGPDRQGLLPDEIEDALRSWSLKALAVLLMGLAALGWLALVTWSAHDPSLQGGERMSAHNLLGPVGAVVADLLFQSLGLAAVALLVPLAVWGLELYRREHVRNLGRRVLLWPPAVLLTATALSSLPRLDAWPINHGYGGLVGTALQEELTAFAASFEPTVAPLATILLAAWFGAFLLARVLGRRLSDFRRAFDPSDDSLERPRGLGRLVAIVAAAGALFATSRPRGAARAQPRGAGRTTPADKTGASAATAFGAQEPSLGGVGTGLGAVAAGSAGAAATAASNGLGTAAGSLAGAAVGAGAAAAGGASAGLGAAAGSLLGGSGAGASGRSSKRDASPGAPTGHGLSEPLDPGFTLDGPAWAEPDGDFVQGADDGALGPAPGERTAGWSIEDLGREIARRFAPAQSGADGGRGGSAAAEHLSLAALGLAAGAALSGGDDDQLRRPANGRQGDTDEDGPAASTVPAQDPRFRLPGLQLLAKPKAPKPGPEFTQSVLRGNARLLEDVLQDYGIKGAIKDIHAGPVVTQYELEPQRGIKTARIIGLADDIARSMSAVSTRIATVPGRNTIGIELPNIHRETVNLRQILEAKAFKTSEAQLPLALGAGIDGTPVIADLAALPHLLVAGTTGSGKSAGLNAMLVSLLYKHTPETCRLLLIDPKMLDLAAYNGIPHLLAPVVTDAARAVKALTWLIAEMEERYKRMASVGVRTVRVFNNRVRHARSQGRKLERTVQVGFDTKSGQPLYERQDLDLAPMPFIVVVIDEMADLVATAGKDFESAVQRLCQMARAAGIHVIAATQRPSADVITGVVKANLPARLSFKVASAVDSRTILGTAGAEQLLGAGDMLFMPGGDIVRVHGSLVTESEIEEVAAFLAAQGAPPDQPDIFGEAAGGHDPAMLRTASPEDALYERALSVVLRDGLASTTRLERQLDVSYRRATQLIARMEKDGIVTPPDATGRREIIVGAPDDD